MEAFEGFSPADLERWKAIAELQKKASESLNGYYETLKLLRELESNLKHINKEKLKTEKKLSDLAKLKLELEKDRNHMENKNYQALLKEIKIEEKKLEIAEEMLRIGQANVRILSEQINSSNLLVASTRSLVSGLKTVGGHLEANLSWWIDQQKAAKMAGFSMGILSKQSVAFRENLYKSSLSTNALGVDTKMLAQMQASYSEQVGRSVQLSEQGLIAMAELANGTVLGAEGAANLVSEMENFNISAERSADIVETMLNNAHKMGVNGAKSTRELEKNLKLANRYNFKDGIEGLGKMVNLATKFKVEMSQIADFADKVMDIEGAVEMAAQLQVLGGGWSKLGDPFQLMFKARNDLKGFTEDIISATDVTGQFNKETGEFEITALEMNRLREVAKATGLDFNMLSESAKAVAKNAQIKGKITGFFSDEEKEFIASLAQYDNKRKTYVLRIDGSDVPVNEMAKFNKNQIKAIREEQARLDERAKDSQTFDETWKNIVNTFKSAFLPGFERFSQSISTGLDRFRKWMVDTDFIDKVVNFGRVFGETTAWFIDKIVEWPKTTAAIIGAALIGKELAWIGRGILLGEGFNMTANVNGGGGALSDMIGGNGRRGRLRSASRIEKFAKGWGGAGAGLLAGGMAGYSEYSQNSDNGMSTGENIGRTGIRAGLAGGGAWGGASLGATIGTMIFPGIGTAIGGLIGGIAGGLAGDKLGDAGGDLVFDNVRTQQDFIARPGSDPIPFSSADTLVGLKKDGGLGKALIDNGSTNSTGKMEVKFTNPIKLEGNLTVSSSDGSSNLDLNNPMFIRALTEMIQKELTRNISGGKISSNPIN